MGEAARIALGGEAMANYILLMTLTPEGREKALADPERVVRAGHLDGYCPGDEFNGNVVFSHSMGDHTKMMQGDRLIGVDLQYLLINSLSLRKATRNIVLHGKV